MLSKKILINGNEAYIQSNVNPVGWVTIHWIVSSILRTIRIAKIDHDFFTNVMRYDYILYQDEIINLNGFDYSIDNPDYSLIETEEIASLRNQSSIAIPETSFQTPVPLSAITAVSLFPLNATWKHHFKALGQEDIIDWSTLTFRQPFYSETSKVDETVKDANDGMINIKNAWGGDTNLEYSIDDGVTWQVNSLFDNLVSAIYSIKVKDGLGNESTTKEIEIIAIPQPKEEV